MLNTITVRLPEDLAGWLTEEARRTGVSRGRVIRDLLEKARAVEEQPFMRLAGVISGAPYLSSRKGFSPK